MIWISTIGSLAVLWVLGALTLMALGTRPRDGVHAVAAEFVTGTTILAALGMAAISVGLSLSVAPIYALVIVLAIVVLRRESLRGTSVRLPHTPAAKAALACAALVVTIVIAASVNDRLWWDGWAIWTLKSRILFLDGTLPAALFGGGYAFAHLDYPLAVPLVDWWSWRHAGTAAPGTASFIGAWWYAILPALLWSGLRTRSGENVAALGALGMALFWPIPFYATGGTADVVIAVALLGAIIELDRALSLDDRGALMRCALFLTLGVLAKNEGLAIAVVVVIITIGAMLRQGIGNLRRIAPLALPFAAIAPWWLFVDTLEVRATVMAPVTFSALGERLPAFLHQLGGLLSSTPWLPLSLLGTVGVTAAFWNHRSDMAPGWLILAGYFSVVAVVYLLTPHDIAWLLTTSLPRVLSVFVPPLVYLCVVTACHDDTPAVAV